MGQLKDVKGLLTSSKHLSGPIIYNHSPTWVLLKWENFSLLNHFRVTSCDVAIIWLLCFTVTLLLDLLVTGGIYYLFYLQCFHQTSTLSLLQTTSWQWHLCHNINPRDSKQAYLTRTVSHTVRNQMTCNLSNKVSHTPFTSPFHTRFPWQTVKCTMSWWAQLIGNLSKTLLGPKPQGTLINIPTRC